ncbi:unnamed protein product [Ectocarpus sp. 13 AM-2016]
MVTASVRADPLLGRIRSWCNMMAFLLCVCLHVATVVGPGGSGGGGNICQGYRTQGTCGPIFFFCAYISMRGSTFAVQFRCNGHEVHDTIFQVDPGLFRTCRLGFVTWCVFLVFSPLRCIDTMVLAAVPKGGRCLGILLCQRQSCIDCG